MTAGPRQVKLLYFARLRQQTGVAEEDFSLPSGVTTVAQLIDVLRKRGPGFAGAFGKTDRLHCAVNQNHTSFDAKIAPGDEIAFFPPVTGG